MSWPLNFSRKLRITSQHPADRKFDGRISMMDLDKLQKILDKENAKACLEYFCGRSEKERRECAKLAATHLKKVDGGRTAAIAATSACSFSELKKLDWRAFPQSEDVIEVLGDRRPDWIDKWVMLRLENEWYWAPGVWQPIYTLAREGLCRKPDHPHYYLGMIGGTSDWTKSGKKAEQRLYRMLVDDEDLLNDVWKLFELEGGGENSLANHDRFTHGAKWSTTLLKLAKEGRLSRERLLDSSLDALERGFNHYRAKWFSEFHELLEPTDEERKILAARYLHLLASPTPTIVAWTLKRVQAIQNKTPFDSAELIDALLPCVRSRKKGQVTAALKLLGQAVKCQPDAAEAAASVACEGLGHEAPDVQEKAFDIVEKLSLSIDSPPVDRVQEFRHGAAASLAQRLDHWLSRYGAPADVAADDDQIVRDKATEELSLPDDVLTVLRELDPALAKYAGLGSLQELVSKSKTPPDLSEFELPSIQFDGTDIPRLDPEKKLSPIEDLDELIEVCSRVAEDEELIDETFRALDGISRLCNQRPEDFDQKTGPLRKRVAKLLEQRRFPFLAFGPGHDICGVIDAWLNEKVCEPIEIADGREGTWFTLPHIEFQATEQQKLTCSPAGVLSQLSLIVSRRVALRGAAPLLCAPTHASGWIDPRKFANRVNDWIIRKKEPPTVDLCLALLRLAHEYRSSALKSLKTSRSEWVRAIRYALGGRSKIGDSAALWTAAARSRTPLVDIPELEAKHPMLGPGAGKSACYLPQTPADGSGPMVRLRIKCEPEFRKARDISLIPVMLHRPLHYLPPKHASQWWHIPIGGERMGTVAAARTLWPSNLEGYFACAAGEIASNLDWWGAYWHHRGYLDVLLDPDVPLTPMANLLLAVTLASKEPGEHGLAVDVSIAAIEDGRLNAEQFGERLAWLLPTGLVKPDRWAKRLTEVSQISPLHSESVRRILERTLQIDPAKTPRGTGSLIELLNELAIESGEGIETPACLAFLNQSTKGSSKAARATRRLLAVDRDHSKRQAFRTDTLNSAIQYRIDRVHRWMQARDDQ
jgi:hypothetical protein